MAILEVLIIVMMPVMVALMVAVHAWAPAHAQMLSADGGRLHGHPRRRDVQRALRHLDG